MLKYLVKLNFFRLNARQIFKMHVHFFDFDEDAYALMHMQNSSIFAYAILYDWTCAYYA